MPPDLEWTNRAGGGAVDLEIFKRKSWPGITAQFARIAAPLTYDFKLSSSLNYIALRDIYRVDGETVVSGLPPSFMKDLRGKLAFVPAGCTIEGWTRIEKPASIIFLMIDEIASIRQSTDLKQLSPLIDFDDPMLRSVLLRFQAILDDPSLDVPGYAETLSELLVFELARAVTGQPAPQGGRSGLTTGQLRLVTEYMDAHLNEKLTIAALAALVDLTRFHFIRAFKQTAGVPPHQFLIRRRVERAKQLLTDEPRATIAEVADRTGFGMPVQMTRAFRRVLGTTPSAVRRDQPL
jgi:AraC family transcriptional regulator